MVLVISKTSINYLYNYYQSFTSSFFHENCGFFEGLFDLFFSQKWELVILWLWNIKKPEMIIINKL